MAVEGHAGPEGEVGVGGLVGWGLGGCSLAARRGPGRETEMARKKEGWWGGGEMVAGG